MENLHVDINWIHYNGDTENATGFVAGATAFVIKNVLPGGYRLTVNIPEPMYMSRWERESFHTSMDAAKDAAKPYASTTFRNLASAVVKHPAIASIDKVTQFLFPAQLCLGGCEFYGGNVEHEDIMVEKHTDSGRWLISRNDGRLYHNPSQEWLAPTTTGTDMAWLADFLWPLEEALEQAHFMHCG